MRMLAFIAALLLLAGARPSLADDFNTNADIAGADVNAIGVENNRSDYEPWLDVPETDEDSTQLEDESFLNEEVNVGSSEEEDGTSASGTYEKEYEEWDGIDLDERPIPPMAGDRGRD